MRNNLTRWSTQSGGCIMMGAMLEAHPPNAHVGAVLRRERIFARLSITQIAAFYRKGVSRQRIFQIEAQEHVGPDAVKDFRAAIRLASDYRSQAGNAVARVLAKIQKPKKQYFKNLKISAGTGRR